MISKTFFCDLLRIVEKVEKKFDHLEKFLGHPICECDFYEYTAGIVELLTKETGLENIDVCEDLIYDFAYNHDWGNDGEVSVNIGGVDKTASNFEELYDLIKELTENPE